MDKCSLVLELIFTGSFKFLGNQPLDVLLINDAAVDCLNNLSFPLIHQGSLPFYSGHLQLVFSAYLLSMLEFELVKLDTSIFLKDLLEAKFLLLLLLKSFYL